MTDRLDSKPRRRIRLSGWIIAWVIVWIANWTAYGLRDHTGLALYVETSQHFIEGSKLYRSTGEDTKFDRFAYPPAMTLPTVPLLPFDVSIQRILWSGFNAALLIFSIALVNGVVRDKIENQAREQGKNLAGLYALFWVIVGAVMIRHILSPLENQSQDVLILALIAWGVWAGARGNDITMGGSWGIAAALKLTPLLFLVLLFIQGRIRAAIVMLAAFLLVSIAPDLLLPREEGGPRITAYYNTFGEAARPGQSGGAHWAKWYQLNQNLAGTIYRISMPPPENVAERYRSYPLIPMSEGVRSAITYTLQGFILLAVVLAGLQTRGPPKSENTNNTSLLAASGVTVCAMLLLSPQSSKSHFIVLLIPAAAVALYFVLHPRDLLCIAVLIVSFLAGTLTSKGLLGKDLGEEVLAAGPVALAALVLGVGSLYVTLASKADPAPAS